jgi:hypothetical protein
MEGTFEPEKVMLMMAVSDAPNRQEMAYESRGQQPVVVLKWSNVHGAKGHSYFEKSRNNTSCFGNTLPYIRE